MKRFRILVCLLVGITIATSVQAQSLHNTRLIDDWEFYKGDLGGVWEALRTGRPAELPVWEQISVPHSYNAYDGVDPDVAYYEGPAWYRTQLSIDNPYKDGRTLLHFEGAGQKTSVYVFDQLVGEHRGGYDLETEADLF